MKHLLVVGASGVIGSALVEHVARLQDWRVYALSRRAPQTDSSARFERLPVDLNLKLDCEEALSPLRSTITHVVYAAVHERPGLVSGWLDPAVMQLNLEMLKNVLESLRGSDSLRSVIIMQGTKAYGAHVHPILLPAIEDGPRDPHANFYWLQEDYLREVSAREGWTWTIFRPQIVLGGACGVSMNPIPMIAAYAAICREEGIPCGFPGAHMGIWEAADARLVARACIWAFESAAARNQIFNITNGDVWVPGHRWPEICAMLNVEPGPQRPVDFVQFVIEKVGVWKQVVRKEKLQTIELSALAGESHHYLNMILCNGQPSAPWPPALVSTIKLRQAGFHDCISSLESMRHWFGWLAQRKLMPAVFGNLCEA